MSSASLVLTALVAVLLLGGLIRILLVRQMDGRVSMWVGVFGFLLALVLALVLLRMPASSLLGVAGADVFTAFFAILISACGLIGSLGELWGRFGRRSAPPPGYEMAVAAGLVLLVASSNLWLLAALVVIGYGSAVLWLRGRKHGQRSAAGISAAILATVVGCLLVGYGSDGAYAALQGVHPGATVGLGRDLGLLLILLGLGPVIGLFPFQWVQTKLWLDSGQGADRYVMLAAMGAAGLGAAVRLGMVGFPGSQPLWGIYLGMAGATTVTLTNVLGLAERRPSGRLTRVQASQWGYAACALVSVGLGGGAALFALTATAATVIVAVAAEAGAVRSTPGRTLGKGAPATKSNTWVTGGTIVALMSAAAVPPMAGFFARYFVFASVLDAGIYWLALVLALNTAVGWLLAAQPLRSLVQEGVSEASPQPLTWGPGAVAAVGGLCVGAWGLFSGPLALAATTGIRLMLHR